MALNKWASLTQRRERNRCLALQARNPQQGLQPIAPAGRHHRHQLAQPVAEVIPPRLCVQPRPAVDPWSAGQTPCLPRILLAGRLPTHAFCQMLRDLVVCRRPGPPSSRACPLAIEESRPSIKGSAHRGTSARFSLFFLTPVSTLVYAEVALSSGILHAELGDAVI